MSNNGLDFSGKVAIVTGASSGMGLATAQAFAEAGASVVLADVREELVKAESAKLFAIGKEAIAVRCDVSDDAQVAAMADHTVAEFGRLDIVTSRLRRDSNAGAYCPCGKAGGDRIDSAVAV